VLQSLTASHLKHFCQANLAESARYSLRLGAIYITIEACNL